MNEYREPAGVVMHLDPNAAREERALERKHTEEMARIAAAKSKARWEAFGDKSGEVMFGLMMAVLMGGFIGATIYGFGYDVAQDAARAKARIECLEGKR